MYIMFLTKSSRVLRSQWRVYNGLSRFLDSDTRRPYGAPKNNFHSTRRLQVVKPVLLADIGEGSYHSSLLIACTV